MGLIWLKTKIEIKMSDIIKQFPGPGLDVKVKQQIVALNNKNYTFDFLYSAI